MKRPMKGNYGVTRAIWASCVICLIVGAAAVHTALAVSSVQFYRKLIGRAAQVAINTPTQLVFDHASLVQAGKAAADGRDLQLNYVTSSARTAVSYVVGRPPSLGAHATFDESTLGQSPLDACGSATGPIARIPADDLTSGGGCAGEAQGAVSSQNVSVVPGEFTKAMLLNPSAGVSSAAYAIAATAWSQTTSALSVEAWVYPNATPTATQQILARANGEVQLSMLPTGQLQVGLQYYAVSQPSTSVTSCSLCGGGGQVTSCSLCGGGGQVTSCSLCGGGGQVQNCSLCGGGGQVQNCSVCGSYQTCTTHWVTRCSGGVCNTQCYGGLTTVCNTCTAPCNTCTAPCNTCTAPCNTCTAPCNTCMTQATYSTSLTTKTITSTGLLTPKRWSHVIVTADAANNAVKIYLNGQQDSAATPETYANWKLSTSGDATLLIGSATAGQALAGLVDEVGVYKTVLAAATVTAHYQRGLAADSISNTPWLPLQFIQIGAGLSGQAWTLNGTNAVARFPSNPLAAPLSARTIEFWFYPTAADGTLLAAWDAASPGAQYLLAQLVGGIPQLQVGTSAVAKASPAVALTLNDWHHLALRIVSVNPPQAELLIDGVSIGGAVGSGANDLSAAAASYQLGAQLASGLPTAFFAGRIDQLALFTRALDTVEIAARAKQKGGVWNPGLGLKETPLFFTNAQAAIPTLPPMNPPYYALYYGLSGSAPSYNNQQLGVAITAAPVVLDPTENTFTLVTLSSSAVGPYAVGDASPAAAPTLSITDNSGSITKAKGMRIYVPTASLPLVWKIPPTAAVSFSTGASCSGGALSGDGTPILSVSVLADCKPNDVVTVNGAQLADPSASGGALTQAGRGKLWVDVNDDLTCTNHDSCYEADDSQVLTVRELAQLSAPAAQVPNALTQEANSLPGVPLLAFALAAKGGPVNVSELHIDVSNIIGISAGDLTNIQLAPLGAVGTVSISGASGHIDFTGLGALPASQIANGTTTSYTVTADVANAALGDSLTLSIAGDDTHVKASGGTSLAAQVKVAGGPVSKTHTLSGYAVSFSPSTVIVGDPISVSWAGSGAFSQNVAIQYSPNGTLNGAGFAPVCQGQAACASPISWTAPDAVTTATPGKFWLSGQVTVNGLTTDVNVPSKDGLTIRGSLALNDPTGGLGTWPVNRPLAVSWTRKGSFPVDVSFSTDDGKTYSLVGTSGATDTSLTFTPSQTSTTARVEICGSGGVADCQVSGRFAITGISVSSPTATDPPYVIGPTGVSIPVAWNAIGLTTVKLEYCTGACASTQPIPGGGAVAAGGGSFTWMVPTTFGDLSPAMKVRVSNFNDPTSFGDSGAFTIKGSFVITQPAASPKVEQSVRDTVQVKWTTYGAIPQVRLEYKLGGDPTVDGGYLPMTVDAGGAPVAIANSGSFSWTIPDNAVADSLWIRVVDAVAGHPPTASTPVAITVLPSLSFVAPATTDRWLAKGDGYTAKWTAVGWIGTIRVEAYLKAAAYYQDPSRTDVQFFTADVQNPDPTQVIWDGTYSWANPNVFPDVLAKAAALQAWQIPVNAVNPQPLSTVPIELRITDVTPGHKAITQTVDFTAYYDLVEWDVKDLTSKALLPGVSVQESSGWKVANDAIADAPVLRYYPGGTFLATWSKANYFPATVTLSVDQSSVAPIVKSVFLESQIEAQIPMNVQASFNYDDATKQVSIVSWLERRGLLRDASMVSTATVELYDSSGLVATLNAAAPDANGTFRLTWDASTAQPGMTYFAKVTISDINGTPFTSGEALNITIPQQIAQTAADVSAVKAATVGPDSTLTQVNTAVSTTLPAQLTQTSTDIQNAVSLVGGKVDDVKTDTTAIKAQTDLISTKVVPAITGVQSYLESPDTGLPKLQDLATQQANTVKALHRGALLNRDTAVDLGETIRLQYRSAGGTPSLALYDANGALVATPPLALNAATGLYEALVSPASLGEYRAVVTEPASADSGGTIDSITVTVRAPRASAQAVGDVAAQLTSLTAQMQTIETGIDQLAANASAIQATANTTKSLADQLSANTKDLLSQGPALTADQLAQQLQNLSMAPIMEKLTELQKEIESAQGSGAAVSFSQSASTSAAEAVTILKQLQSDASAHGTDATGLASALTQLNAKLGSLSDAVGRVPTGLTADQLMAQLQTVADQVKAISTQKGYHFDALYETTKEQSNDVKAVRNRVEELKTLLDLQRALLEHKLNQPTVKTWFESGP